MSTIPASVFANVTPSVLSAGGSAAVLSGLMLTNNTRVPIGTILSFSSAAAVTAYFGAGTKEAAAAAVYFAGFDNSTAKPSNMLFAQYNTASVPAYVRGGNAFAALSLTQLQALNALLNVTIDGVLKTATINLSAATSFSNAAMLIQNGLGIFGIQTGTFTGSITASVLTLATPLSGTVQIGGTIAGTGITAGTYISALLSGTLGAAGSTYSVVGTASAASTTVTAAAPAVTFDSVSGAFSIFSGTTGAGSSITVGSGPLATSLLLTLATGAVLSQGAIAAVPATFMAAIVLQNMPWATFFLGFDPDNGSGNTQKMLFATWNGQQNNAYAFIAHDTDTTPRTQNPASASMGQLLAAASISGTILISELTDQNLAAFAAGVIASIDFTRLNGRTTLKFRFQSGLVADVTDQTTQANLTANNYNFYGAFANTLLGLISFANGVVSGPFKWADSFINQIWLNSALQAALINLLSTATSIPYNSAGYSQIEAALADPINAGLNFGVFRAGVTISAAQIAAVNAAAGKNIATVLSQRGWYLLIQDASPTVRAARGSPPITFFYVDGQSVQSINLASIVLL